MSAQGLLCIAAISERCDIAARTINSSSLPSLSSRTSRGSHMRNSRESILRAGKTNAESPFRLLLGVGQGTWSVAIVRSSMKVRSLGNTPILPTGVEC